MSALLTGLFAPESQRAVAGVQATEKFIVSSQIFKTFHLITYFSGDKGRAALFFPSNLLPAVGPMES